MWTSGAVYLCYTRLADRPQQVRPVIAYLFSLNAGNLGVGLLYVPASVAFVLIVRTDLREEALHADTLPEIYAVTDQIKQVILDLLNSVRPEMSHLLRPAAMRPLTSRGFAEAACTP